MVVELVHEYVVIVHMMELRVFMAVASCAALNGCGIVVSATAEIIITSVLAGLQVVPCPGGGRAVWTWHGMG